MIAKPGTGVDQMVLNIDLAPTVLDIAGIPVPSNMEGRAITPLLRDTRAPWRKAWLYEYFKDFPYQVPEIKAVRTDRYKYIKYQGRKPAELFDLINDPREKKNLINTPEGRRILPQLKEMLEDLKEGKQP
jgi:N-acetylglucosamine-6-sulfatase